MNFVLWVWRLMVHHTQISNESQSSLIQTRCCFALPCLADNTMGRKEVSLITNSNALNNWFMFSPNLSFGGRELREGEGFTILIAHDWKYFKFIVRVPWGDFEYFGSTCWDLGMPQLLLAIGTTISYSALRNDQVGTKYIFLVFRFKIRIFS